MSVRKANLQMVTKLLVITVGMFAFGYALIPIYKHVCEALGINILTISERQVPGNGVVGKMPANTQVDTSRTITVEFDANARGPWDFKPERVSMQVHPGELATVMYEFQNIQNRAMAAQAIPSYAPRQAAPHFTKLECFCFNQYELQAGEKKAWPVAFVIDPKLPKDVTTITLSYTFFEVGGRVPSAPVANYSAVLAEGGVVSEQPRKPSLWRSIQAMAWALLGVRKGSEWHKDSAQIKPLQILAVGVVAIFVFVLLLIGVVNWVVER